MTTKTWSRNMGRLAIDPNQSGLVAGYSMVPRVDGTIEDLSGNGNHGTINGPGFEYTEIGPSMRFDGVDDHIACGAGFQALNDVSLCAWIWPEIMSASEWLINYYLSINDAWGIRALIGPAGYTGIEIYDDIDNANAQLYGTDIKIGVPHLIVAQMESLENKLYIDGELVGSGVFSTDDWASFAGILYQGARQPATGATPCSISNVKIFNRALTATEIQAEYNAGAKAVNWKSDYGVSDSTAAESAPGELSNSPARVISGSFKISSDTIDGCTAKVIECVTAGVVAIPTAYFHGSDTQAAHGTFELRVNKVLDANVMTIGVTGNQATAPAIAGYNGYAISIAADESLSLLEFTNGAPSTLLSTAAGFVSIATWHKLKLTISATGEFTLYMNDTLVDVTGGSGTNPVTDTTYTTSKYVVLDSDAGDKAAWSAKNGSCAIVKYQGVV